MSFAEREVPAVASIVAVTHVVPDLVAIESAYTRYLGYRVILRGTVDEATASGWNAPGMAGRPQLLLEPESRAPVYLRFVEAGSLPGHAALKTHGWNATEILVEDPDALATRLVGSPFRIIGPPRDLQFNRHIRAMQALGPAGELLYLTRVPPGKSLFDLGSARTFVDRVFIVVVGGPDIEALRAFYRDALGMPVTEAAPTGVAVLNAAWGLPWEHQTLLAVARFPDSFLVELDQYPAAARPRPVRTGELPPGMALVSFAVADLAAINAPFLADPAVATNPPFAGRRTALVRGAAGELIELVEAPDAGRRPATGTG